MNRKNAPIFQLNNKDVEIKKLARLQDLLNAGNYKDVIKEAENLRKIYPNNFFFFTIGSIGLSLTGKTAAAKKLLLTAEKKFPTQYEVHYQLAKVYEDCEEYENAEESYKKSYELTPEEYNDARSDCLSDLGALYWSLRRKDDAVEQWKLALMEDPENIKAKNNYRNFTNEYGEPVTVDVVMDDLFHFQNIQMEKYFKNQNIEEFRSMEEAQQFLDLVKNTWNKKITGQKKKLDKLSPMGKTKWFDSIDIDFVYEEPAENIYNSEEDLTDFDIESLIENSDEMFPYLPSGTGVLIPFAGIVLGEIGYKENRILEILEGDDVSEAEEYYINWAIDIILALFAAWEKKNSKKEIEMLDDAVDIALEELDEEEAIQLVSTLKHIIYVNIDKGTLDTKKKKKSGKKRKKSK